MSPTAKKIIFTAIVLIVTGMLVWPRMAPFFSSSTMVGPDSAPSHLQVEGVVITPQILDNVIYTSGTVEANETVDLRSEIPGKVVEIHFDEGSRVTAGQLLVKTNDNELQAERRRTEFQLRLAEQREERQRRLLERGGVSQQEYDVMLNEVNMLQASLDLIDARIEKTEIRAPFDGLIGLKYISEGSFISSESRIATLNDIDQVKVEFSVPERYLSSVQPGDRLFFRVQGSDSTFVGEVYALEPRIDLQTRTLRIRARSDNNDHRLLPGAFANIEFLLESRDDALMIPSISVIPGFERQTTFVYRGGRVEEVEIRTGIRTDEAVQIVEGIVPGDTVLTTGLLQVRPGVEVNLTRVTWADER